MSFHSNGDNTTIQCDIDYANQKEQLIREQQNKEYELKVEYEETLSKVRNTYSQAILDLEKKYKESKLKESAEEHAKILKAVYDGYISQGFTKKQAKHFIKIVLENQSK